MPNSNNPSTNSSSKNSASSSSSNNAAQAAAEVEAERIRQDRAAVTEGLCNQKTMQQLATAGKSAQRARGVR